DLGVGVRDASWIVTAYLVAMAALQPIAGRIGDRYGRRRVMLAALAYFTVASLGAALAPSLPVLAFFRLQQAISAAAVVPNGLGVLLLATAWWLSTLDSAPDLPRLAALAAIGVGAWLFVRYERSRRDPALPLWLFRVRAFTAANATIAFSNLAMYGTLLAL